MTTDLLFICGGAWSGKTTRAMHLASSHSSVIWLGTAANTLAGLDERVATLKALRPQSWTQIDAPFNLPKAIVEARIRNPKALLIVDSVSQWIGNEIAKLSTKHDEKQIAEELNRDIDDLCASLRGEAGSIIVVSSDFGISPPPQEPSSRALRMCVGRANQRLSDIAKTIELMMAGLVFSTIIKD